MLVTRILRDSRIAARDAAAMPFPSEETTPPVTKTYLVIYLARVRSLGGKGGADSVQTLYKQRLGRPAGTMGSPWTTILPETPARCLPVDFLSGRPLPHLSKTPYGSR